jgi:CheY-like chemotaxis protein
MSTLRVLLCEENQINRRIMRRILELNNLLVEEVSTPIDAIDLLESNNFTFVLVDQHTASLNEYETIKKFQKVSQVPIVLSSSDVSELGAKLKELGVIAIVQKPLQVDAIKELVDGLKVTVNPDDFKEFNLIEFKKVYVEDSFQKDIIKAFMDESENDLKRIKDAYKTKDIDTIYGALHYMKGTFSYIKAFKILDFTQSILNKLKEKDLEFALDLEGSFYNYYQKLFEDLKAYLKRIE